MSMLICRLSIKTSGQIELVLEAQMFPLVYRALCYKENVQLSTSVWKIVLNCGLRKFCHDTSIGTTC